MKERAEGSVDKVIGRQGDGEGIVKEGLWEGKNGVGSEGVGMVTGRQEVCNC